MHLPTSASTVATCSDLWLGHAYSGLRNVFRNTSGSVVSLILRALHVRCSEIYRMRSLDNHDRLGLFGLVG